MNIKNVFLTGTLLLSSVIASAQGCKLPVTIQLDEQFTGVPVAAQNALYNSLTRIATASDFSTSDPNTPFVLTVHCDVLDKSNIPGAPIKTVYNLGLTFYLADTYSMKKFATAYITLNGVGTGEVKSYINAFSGINAERKEIQKLISEGKTKMMNYYDTEYRNIIKEAQRLESQQKFENALAVVLAIPSCSRGYGEVSKYAVSLYSKNLDRMNLFLLNKARAAWAAGQDQQTAYDVCEMLADIDPDASCYKDAAALMKEIKGQVRSDIDFEMRQKYTDAVKQENARIEAARAVGVAFGNGQKAQTTNLMWMR